MLLFSIRRCLFTHIQNLANCNLEYRVVKKFTQEELNKFSELTGDMNKIHSTDVSIDHRKVHGALLNAVVSGIIGTRFPGQGTIVLQQTFRFPKPCRINVDTQIFLRLQKLRKISLITYECKQNNDIVFQGEAKLLIKS